MKFRLATVVWGTEFLDTFLRVSLRTLLATGNIPELALTYESTYTIYTTPEGAAEMAAHPVFEKLQRAIHIQMSIFQLSEIDAGNPGSHGIFWNRGLELARRNNEVLFFIIPDLVYAEGTLLRWASRFEAGAGAIFTLGPQVVLETIVPELEQRFPDSGTPCSLSRDGVFDLLFRHFHPLHGAMRHDSDRRPPHPEYDLRLVPERGFVIREIVSHPFCVDPCRYGSLRHYGPQDHVQNIVLEAPSTLSVEPLLKQVHGYYRPWPLDEARLSNLGSWWNFFATRSCEYESAFPFFICSKDDSTWQAGQRRVVAAGQFYRNQIVFSGRLYQLFAELRTREHYRAANLLAAAHYAGRLRRKLTIADDAILLLPSETALAENATRITELLAPGREREFVNLIANHVILRKEQVQRSKRLSRSVTKTSPSIVADHATFFTASGIRAEPLLQTLRHTQSFISAPFTIYIIDRVLWEDTAISSETELELPGADARLETSAVQIFPSALPRSVEPVSRPFVVTRWGRRSPLHRILYYGFHIPFLELFLALLFPVYFAEPIKNVLRRYPDAHRIKNAWRSGELTPACIVRHGGRVALRVVGRVPVVGPSLRRVYASVEGGRLGRLAGLFVRVISVVKRDGPELAWRKVRARLTATKVAVLLQGRLSPDQEELLQEIRKLRSFLAAREILAELQAKMKSKMFQSAPLALIDKLLEARELNVVQAQTIVERELIELTNQVPACSEAWLELAFLYQDNGRPEQAASCFRRANDGMRLVDTAGHSPHPGAVAAAQLGRVLMVAGREKEAASLFSRSLDRDPSQNIVAVEYANALRHLGRIEEALTYYGEGMNYHAARWSLPPFPRDAREVWFPKLEKTGNSSYENKLKATTSGELIPAEDTLVAK